MAAVNITEVKPATNSVNPAILFECTIDLRRRPEILLACEGSLWCDEKRIGTASVEYENWSSGSHTRNLRMSSQSTDTVRATFHVPLTHHALAFLEEHRDEHSNGNVELTLRCYTRSLVLNINAHRELIFELGEQSLKGEMKEPKNGRTRLPISVGEEYLGQVRTETRPSQYTIPSSDWAQEFAPALGLGEFLLFEYPALTDFAPVNDVSEDTEEEGESLTERLKDATKSLQRVQESIRRGEWDIAMTKMRDVAGVLKDKHDDVKDFEKEIRAFMIEDGLRAEAAKNITTSMRHLYHYLSKFEHRMDRGGKTLMPRQKASKEDAYLAYTMGTAVVNLLTAKLKRSENRSTS